MNAIFPTVLKRLYRKEPISSFIIIVGAVDAVLGGVNELGALMILGLLTSGMAIGYRDPDAAVNNFAVPRVEIDQAIRWDGF